MDGGSRHCIGDRDQDHPHGWKKAKWLPEEALQIAVKRREVKSKGEKERYKHLNAEFHVHRVSDAIQPSPLLSSPSPPVPKPSQHQSLFQ